MSRARSSRWALLVGLVASGCGPPPAPASNASATPAMTAQASRWTVDRGQDLPVPLANNAVAAATVDGRGFVFSFLGLGSGRDYKAITTEAYIFDVAAGHWARLPDVPGAVGRLAATAQAIGSSVYVIGGYAVAADGRETTSPAVDVYDIRARRYSRGADTAVPIDDTVSGVWRDRLVYLVSGWSSDRTVTAVQIYDPASNAWRAATPIPGTPVFGHAGAIAGDTIVYCGGARMQPGQTPKYAPSAECFRGDIDPAAPATVRWRAIALHPGGPRYRAAAGPVDSGLMTGVLFTGGTTNPYNYNGVGYDGRPAEPEPTSWIYDVQHDQWVEGPSISLPTMDHRGLVRLADHGWIVGGIGAGQIVSSNVTRIRVAPGADTGAPR